MKRNDIDDSYLLWLLERFSVHPRRRAITPPYAGKHSAQPSRMPVRQPLEMPSRYRFHSTRPAPWKRVSVSSNASDRSLASSAFSKARGYLKKRKPLVVFTRIEINWRPQSKRDCACPLNLFSCLEGLDPCRAHRARLSRVVTAALLSEVAEVVALPDLRSEVPEDRVRDRNVEEEVG